MVKPSIHIALSLRHAATLAAGTLNDADRASLTELLRSGDATGVALANHLLAEAERFLDPAAVSLAERVNTLEHRIRTIARMLASDEAIDDYLRTTLEELDAGTVAPAAFTPRELRRRRARLERRLAHLRDRVLDLPENDPRARYDISEASALQTALVLFDDALTRGHHG